MYMNRINSNDLQTPAQSKTYSQHCANGKYCKYWQLAQSLWTTIFCHFLKEFQKTSSQYLCSLLKLNPYDSNLTNEVLIFYSFFLRTLEKPAAPCRFAWRMCFSVNATHVRETAVLPATCHSSSNLGPPLDLSNHHTPRVNLTGTWISMACTVKRSTASRSSVFHCKALWIQVILFRNKECSRNLFNCAW